MSEATELSEKKRRKIIHYTTALESFKVELKDFEGSKRDRILELAKLLEEAGHPKEAISEKVGDDLSGYLSKQYVRKVLSDEYKDPKQVRNQAQTVPSNISERATSSAIVTEEDNNLEKQPIAVTNTGSQEFDSFYGKTKEQMRLEAEADEEVKEDKEGTLEGNPSNMLRETPNPAKEPLMANNSNSNNTMISDSSPELRDMLARVAELEEALRIQKEEAVSKGKRYEELHKKWAQNSPENLLRQIEEYKHTIRKMQEIVDVNNEQIKSNFDYKVFEILKLNTKDITLIQQNSWRSEKSVFLLVNPKSHEILDVKTDKEMHRIQSQRRRQEAEEKLVQEAKQQHQGVSA
jgi:hypothetical protein